MKLNSLLLASAVTLMATSVAFATDLPSKKTTPSFEAPLNWSGLYVGATVGMIGLKSDNSYSTYRPGSDWTDSHTDTGVGSGVLAGGTVGYNYQTGSIVLGVETDYSFAGAEAAVNAGDDIWYGAYGKAQISSFGTLRARVGYAVDRALIYVTGGLAFADIDQSAEHSRGTHGFSGIRTGWTAGGGVEYAMTNRVSVKVEALYADFGNDSVETEISSRYRVYEADTTATIGRIGLNVRF